MKLKKLIIDNFGPFRNYEVEFPHDDNVAVLLTGKNNEGKSTIINSLKWLHNATKVVKKYRYRYSLQQDLLKQDTNWVNIGKLLHNYKGDEAKITGLFSNNFQLEVTLDAKNNRIYCEYTSNVPRDVENIFGIIPPLGLLAEEELLISNNSHLTRSLSTSLAPRHLRNHFYHFLTEEDYDLVKEIIKDSWDNVELLNYEHDAETNQLMCFYKENRIAREISWAGQGLQVWLQLITHLVRLKNTSILVLDEPEIFLHPQKQIELVRILREYYPKSIIVATHSVELINSVDISHIIHIKKIEERPRIKSTTDRRFLDNVRSQVGSNFNLIASQFDDVDILIFTEDVEDYQIIKRFAAYFGITKKAFNIPIHGFSQYRSAIYYKDAYEKILGKEILCSLLLDRDYYPNEYLARITEELQKFGIKTFFTPGKEIENIFLNEDMLSNIFPIEGRQDFKAFLNELYERLYTECLGNFLSLHRCLNRSMDEKTIITRYFPAFDISLKNAETRFELTDGKEALKNIRKYAKEKHNINLTTHSLMDTIINTNKGGYIKPLILKIYQAD